jgi:hypothetical protein
MSRFAPRPFRLSAVAASRATLAFVRAASVGVKAKAKKQLLV